MHSKLTALSRSPFKTVLVHLSLWLAYALFWLLLSDPATNTFQKVLSTLAVTAFHAAGSYFNIYVLIPFQLQQKKYFAYVLSLVLTITLLCFPIMMTVHRINEQSLSVTTFWDLQVFFFTALNVSYTMVITMVISLFFRWFNNEQRTRQLQVLNAETELKYLKTQINPHFLFNALNSLYALSLKKSELTPTYILKLSDLLRYLLYEGRQDKVPLTHEIAYLENYLQIEKLRLGDRADIQFNVAGNPEHLDIEPMLFLPFVENAVKHGLATKSRDGWMKVAIQLTDNEIFFSVRNNVQDSNEVLLFKKEGGIGLENVKKRLKIFYPDSHELNITKSSQTFEVALKITFNENQLHHR